MADPTRGCNSALQEVRGDVQEHLYALSHHFKEHCSLTFIMRNPRCPDGHLIITSERDLRALAAVCTLEAERQEEMHHA